MHPSKRILRGIQIVSIIIPIGLFLLLFLEYIAFFGTLSVHANFSKGPSPYVTNWSPIGRALDPVKNLKTGNTSQDIAGEPVYMTVKVPRSFDTVDVTMEYENPRQPSLEFGVATLPDAAGVRLYPFQQKIIDAALQEWDHAQNEAGVHLLQKTKSVEVASVDDFQNQPPQDARIGVYKIAAPLSYTDSEYEPKADTSITIEHALKGSHEFFTYVKNETLQSTFTAMDTNESEGSDPLTLDVFDAHGQLVHTHTLEDDGSTQATREASAEKQFTVELDGLPEGVYRMKVSTTPDVIITRIVSQQEKFVVKNSLNLTRVPENGLDITFKGQKILFRTDTEDGVQEIDIYNEPFSVEAPTHPYVWTAPHYGDTTRQMHIARGPLYIQLSDYMAFSQDQYFDPDGGFRIIDETTQLTDLDYILYSSYTPPVQDREVYTQTIPIDLVDVPGNRKEITFVLSAPGLDREGWRMTIHDMQFTFHRAPLYERLLTKLRSL